MSRMLLVEDEDSLATGLVDVLTLKAYHVDRAAEGTEGLDKALTGVRGRRLELEGYLKTKDVAGRQKESGL